MATKRNYTIKSKGDYNILRKKHQKIENVGQIYENNYMTISKFDELFSDSELIYSDSQFKFGVKTGANFQKKHIRGGWISASASTSANCTTENTIRLNSNTNNLRDFVYYGSATMLFQDAVKNIINKFPAEIYFTGNFTIINGTKYYMVDNSYNIDIETKSMDENSSINKLRYFALSFDKYSLIDNNIEDKIVSWEVKDVQLNCNQKNDGTFGNTILLETKNGTKIEIYTYYLGGNESFLIKDKSLINCSLRPDSNEVITFYNNISDFESVLLNRTSMPMYTVTLETPFENEKGMFYDMKDYTWPSTNNYNPKVEGNEFEGYVNGLLSLCDFYDNYYSDHAYRSLTHESLKNLDWTFTRYAGLDVEDLSNIDSSRVEVIDRIYGRQYDEIKRYIDNIKNTNSVSYNSSNGGKSNYELSDNVENNGFEAISLGITKDNSIITNPLYTGESIGYTSSDATIRLFKDLILNSKHLNGLKGTRNGLETMFSLLGFDSDEYEINEYVIVANPSDDYGSFVNSSGIPGITYPNAEAIEVANKLKDRYRDGKIVVPIHEEDDMILMGLPLNYVTVINEDGEESRYAIPWFSRDLKYDGDLYYQMNGGWGRRTSKDINLELSPKISHIISDSKTKFYDETEPAIKFANTLSDLIEIPRTELHNNDIVYVTDLNAILSSYICKTTDEVNDIKAHKFSHYFILENDNLIDSIGYNVDYESYGWKVVMAYEFSGVTSDSQLTENGRRVLYFESLEENESGNNPHIGHGLYDDGQEYIDYMEFPLKYAYDNSYFYDSVTNDELKEINKIRFKLQRYEDNRKCWYFTNVRNINENLYEKQGEEYKQNREVEICKTAVSNFNDEVSMDKMSSDTIPCNPETAIGDIKDEAAANSIINIKNIDIIIKPKNYSNEFKELFLKSMIQYIYYMIPSTSICNIRFLSSDDNNFTVKFFDGDTILKEETVNYGEKATAPNMI